MRNQIKVSPVQFHLPFDSLSTGKEQGKLLYKYCKKCKKKFTVLDTRKIFCSKKCYHLYRRQRTKYIGCKECNKKFLTNFYAIHQKGRTFCSRKCYSLHHLKRPENYIACKECGKKFFVGGVNPRHKGKEYCSRLCFSKHRRTYKIYKKKRRKYIKCKICKKKFVIKLYEESRRKCCSIKCIALYRTKRGSIRVKCKNCRRKFESIKSQKGGKGGNENNYCSLECFRSYKSRFKRDYPKFKKCEYCDKEFLVNWKQHTRRFCSSKCAGLSRGETDKQIKCKECGKKFLGKHLEIKRGIKHGTNAGQFCSIRCASKYSHWGKWNGKNNPIIKNKENVLKSRNARPTKLEKYFNDFTPQIVRYVGNAVWWRKLPDGKHKNPDFKIMGQNKVIELFGDYWHRNDDPQNLINLYNQVGIQCLVFWENEVYNNKEEVIERVNKFISA